MEYSGTDIPFNVVTRFGRNSEVCNLKNVTLGSAWGYVILSEFFVISPYQIRFYRKRRKPLQHNGLKNTKKHSQAVDTRKEDSIITASRPTLSWSKSPGSERTTQMDMSPKSFVMIMLNNHQQRIRKNPAGSEFQFTILVSDEKGLGRVQASEKVNVEVGIPTGKKLSADELFEFIEARGYTMKKSSYGVKRSTVKNEVEEKPQWAIFRTTYNGQNGKPTVEDIFSLEGSRRSGTAEINVDDLVF